MPPANPEMMSLAELRLRVNQVVEEMERRLQDLEVKELRTAALEAKMREQALRCEDRVRLNVGGQVFETHKSNLLRYEGSYFHGMLTGGEWRPDESGCYFIDASPSLFQHVMDVLRGEPLMVDGLSRVEVQRLRTLFDYFQLPCPDSLGAPTAADPTAALARRGPGNRTRLPVVGSVS